MTARGLPERIRCDNGPELTSRHFLAWCVERRIALEHIQPGRPMQNGHVESFHGKFRDECLNVSWFRNLFDAAANPFLASQLQRNTAAQQFGVPDAQRVRRPVATPFVLLDSDTGCREQPDMRTKGSYDVGLRDIFRSLTGPTNGGRSAAPTLLANDREAFWACDGWADR